MSGPLGTRNCSASAEADLEHIAEGIEDMGKRKKHELESRLREELDDLLRDMPSLRNLLQKSLPRVYRRAVTKAVGETGLSRSMFPSDCPFELERILDTEFWPE